MEPSRDIADLPGARVNLAGASAAHISGGPGVAQVIDRLALARSAALLGTAWGLTNSPVST